MNAKDLKRSAQDLIETIRVICACDDDYSVKDALCNRKLLSSLLRLDELNPDDAESVAEHAEAEEIIDKAYSLL